MTKLNRNHNVTPFCDEEEGRHPLHVAKFDARAGAVIACNGRIGIAVPVYDPIPKGTRDGLIGNAELIAGAKNRHEVGCEEGSLTVNGKPANKGSEDVSKYPNLFSAMSDEQPDLVIPLSLETLVPLVHYTKEHGDGAIYLCVNHAKGRTWQERQVNTGIQFSFALRERAANDQVVQAVGVLMPCGVADLESVEAIVTNAIGMATAGKTTKEKAEAARKKAADKKKAAAAEQPKNGKGKNGKGKAKVEPEAEVETVEEPTTTTKPTKATKATKAAKPTKPAKDAGKAVTNGKATKPAKEEAAGDAASATGAPVADLITRARASLSRNKFAAAKRFANSALNEIAAGNVKKDLAKAVEQLHLDIATQKATFKESK